MTAVTRLCPLCQKVGKIVRSHVIPEFLLRAALNRKREGVVISSDGRPARIVQQAFMYPLLCRECERFLNEEYEVPFLEYWRKAAPSMAWGPNYLLQVPSYTKFKLFLLSILWRAGVCSQGEFANVELGEHEPQIREMLLAGQPNTMHDYPIFGAVMLMPRSLQVAYTVVAPYSTEWEGTLGYVFGFGGCVWHYLLRHEPFDDWIHEWLLMEDGRIGLPTIEMSQLNAIDMTFKDYMQLARERGWRNPWERRQRLSPK